MALFWLPPIMALMSRTKDLHSTLTHSTLLRPPVFWALRELKGLTIKIIATRANVDYALLNRLANGAEDVPPDIVKALEGYLGLPASAFTIRHVHDGEEQHPVGAEMERAAHASYARRAVRGY